MSDSAVSLLMKRNCSTIFLLPPIGLTVKNLERYGFVEAYLKDEYNPIEYKNPVFLLFKPDDMSEFQDFIAKEYERKNEFTGTSDLMEDYNRGNGTIVLVYKFPEEFSEDYTKFLNGKYSQFSEKIVKTYPETVSVFMGARETKFLNVTYRIITKDKFSRKILKKLYPNQEVSGFKTMAELLEEEFETEFTDDMELWQKINMDKETLKI